MSSKKDYTRRDDAILWHLAMYRVSLKELLSFLFFDHKECGHVLTRLQAAGLIKVHSKAVAGRFTFVTITAKGAAKTGFPKERGELTGKTIDDCLGLSYACFLDSKNRRVLLSNKEANRLLNADDCIPTNVDVLAAEEPHAVGLFRVYRPDNAKAAVSGLSSLYESFQSDSKIQTAMTAGVFGVAVLARSQKLAQQLQSLLSGNRNPLGGDCHWFVALAPGVDTLGACLKKRKSAA